jgi:predicted nucleotidyltransferase
MNRTVSQLTPDELASYKRIKFNIAKEKQKNIYNKHLKAKQVAKQIANLLYKEYDANKVFLFGSVTKPEFFNEFSDIDIAVIGIPDNLFFAAAAAVSEISYDFKIDLIDLNDCSETLREFIYKEGILI